MSTSTKRRPPAASTNGTFIFADPSQYEFGSPNEPNADILLPSLRAAGYSVESALSDLIDNPIDKHATSIFVNVVRDTATKQWAFEVGDNGTGMVEEILDQMMRLGSRTEHDLDSDLGKFGLGSNTASLALGKNKHVLTIAKGHELLSSMWDLDVIEKTREFVKHLGAATDDEKQLFAAAFDRAGLPVAETGTVVRITKCDQVGRVDFNELVAKIRLYVGQTYRRHLVPNGSVELRINGEPAKPVDPLMRDHKETQVLFDEQVEFTWKDDDGRQQAEKFGVVVVHLPDFGSADANKEKGITIDTSGYYVLRNGREIAAGETFRLFARHNERSRFRCELSIPARLDAHLGVTFLKSTGVGVRLSQALRDKIKEVTNPYRRQSESFNKKSRPNAEETVPHDGAAKQIKKRSSFLRKPETEIEKREPSDKKDDKDNKSDTDTTNNERTRTPNDSIQRALADQALFQAKQMGPYAPFYEASLDGKKVVVTWNSDHPAYQRLVLDNRDNRGQIEAIDYLVWSLASAELLNADDTNAKLMAKMREDSSYNLRQLLTA